MLTITAARKARLANAPSVSRIGAGGGFGAEAEYDTITAGGLEEKVDDFVRLVGGA